VPHWNYQHVGNIVRFDEGLLSVHELTFQTITKHRKQGCLGHCFSCLRNYSQMITRRKKAHSMDEYLSQLESYVKE
jgi:hypothetical protein